MAFSLSNYTAVINVDCAKGNDTTGNGSASNPYQTLNKCFSQVSVDNTLIYLVGAGTYVVPSGTGGFHSLCHNSKNLTYAVSKGVITQAVIDLQDGGSDFTQIMSATATTCFKGLTIKKTRGGDGRAIDYWDGGSKLNIVFDNCLFLKDASGNPGDWLFYTSNSGTPAIYNFLFRNCFFQQNFSGVTYGNASSYSNTGFVNCAWAYGKPGPVGAGSSNNLYNVTYDTKYNITSTGWKGTGLNGADIGLYGGNYTWAPTKILLKDALGNIYDYTTQLNNRGIASDDTALLNLFNSYGMDAVPTPTQLAPLGNNCTILCYALDLAPIKTSRAMAFNSPKLVLPNSDIGLASIQSVNLVSIAANQAGNGKIRIVVSVNKGKTWQTWDSINGIWTSIDISSLDNVVTNAMLPATLNARTKTDWTSLIGSSAVIRFGYYFEISAVVDIASTDIMTLNVDMKGRWRGAYPGSEVDHFYGSTNTLDISLYASGDYKINY